MIFRAACKDGLITDDPAEFVETVRDRREEAAHKPFTVEQLRAVLRECDEAWKSLVLFGLYTARRAVRGDFGGKMPAPSKSEAKQTAILCRVGQPWLDNTGIEIEAGGEILVRDAVGVYRDDVLKAARLAQTRADFDGVGDLAFVHGVKEVGAEDEESGDVVGAILGSDGKS